MALRFRKSVRIAPGIRINFSRSGASLSAGRRGASMTFGPRGVSSSVGIPGSGLSYRTSTSSGRRTSSGGSGKGKSGPTAAEQKAFLLEELEAAAAEYNETADFGINQHKITPHRVSNPDFEKNISPLIWNPALLPKKGKISPAYWVGAGGAAVVGVPGVIETSAASAPLVLLIAAALASTAFIKTKRAKKKYAEDMGRYSLEKEERRQLHEQASSGDVPSMEKILQLAMDQIDWFRETFVSFEISSSGEEIFIDIDLPEISDIPDCVKVVRKTKQEIEDKTKKEEDIRKEYMIHVHGIILRVAGTCFSIFPKVKKVLCSGYTQRINPATGKEQNDYVLSVIFDVGKWKDLNIENADPVQVYKNFPCRRDVAQDKILNEIRPFEVSEVGMA